MENDPPATSPARHSPLFGAAPNVPLPRPLESILLGGLTVGTLDALNATGFWWLTRGVAPGRIFQSIASGLLGKGAFSGGAAAAWLGFGLHYFIAFGVATVFYLACRVLPVLLRRPVIFGILYGAVVFLVMNFVVIPLSRHAPGLSKGLWFCFDFGGHLLIIGLPVALIAHWSATRPIRRAAIR